MTKRKIVALLITLAMLAMAASAFVFTGCNGETPPPAHVPVESITITGTNPRPIILGAAVVTLTANVLPANATYNSVTWSSSAPAVATVDAATGAVTAQAAGETTITATSVDNPDVTATLLVQVNLPPATGVTITPASTAATPHQLLLGDGGLQLTSAVVPTNPHIVQTVNWTVSAGSAVEVSATGLVTAVAVGNATVTATATHAPQPSANAFFRVVRPATSIVITPGELNLWPETDAQLTASALPDEQLPEGTIAWASNNTAVATVSAAGMVTTVAPGEATITASIGTITGTVAVTVIGSPRPEGAIATPEDWIALTGRNEMITGNFFLMNDLDFTGFEPVQSIGYNGANGDVSFNGTFDGRGFAVRNITIASSPGSTPGSSTNWGAAIFGGTGSAAEIRNLTVINATFASGITSIGLLVGHNRGLVENVFLDGVLPGTGSANHEASGALFGRNGRASGSAAMPNDIHANAIWRNIVTTPRGPSTNLIGGDMRSGSVQNIFVVTDGRTGGAAYANTGLANISDITAFTMADIAAQDFSSLDSEIWEIGDNGLPQLIRQYITGIPVFATPGEGFTFIGTAMAETDVDYEFTIRVHGNTHTGTPTVTYSTVLGQPGTALTPIAPVPPAGYGFRDFNFRIPASALATAEGIVIYVTGGLTARPTHNVTLHENFTLHHGNSGTAGSPSSSAEWRTWDGMWRNESPRGLTHASGAPTFAVIGQDFTFAIQTTAANGHFSGVTYETFILTVTIGGVVHTFTTELAPAVPGTGDPEAEDYDGIPAGTFSLTGDVVNFMFRIPAALITGDIVFVSLAGTTGYGGGDTSPEAE